MIYLLPAMGADSRMYAGPWLQLTDCSFLNWPIYRGELSLAAVAGRVIEDNGIVSTDTIGGSSLGGMVALEIAAKLDIKTIFLFGSAMGPHEVNPVLRALAPLINHVPLKRLQTVAGRMPNLIFKMFSTSDPAFIRATCRAIMHWRGFVGKADKIKRIHGTRDLIISRYTSCRRIPGAGHLLAITHPFECVDFLKKGL